LDLMDDESFKGRPLSIGFRTTRKCGVNIFGSEVDVFRLRANADFYDGSWLKA